MTHPRDELVQGVTYTHCYSPEPCVTKTTMPIIVLIPTLICIIALFRDSVQKAFLNVFIPVFLMLPT